MILGVVNRSASQLGRQSHLRFHHPPSTGIYWKVISTAVVLPCLLLQFVSSTKHISTSASSQYRNHYYQHNDGKATTTAAFLPFNRSKHHRPVLATTSFSSAERLQPVSSSSSSSSLNMASGMKLDSPSAQRNKQAIWDVLSKNILPSLLESSSAPSVRILEVAAGCGVHTEHFALELLKTKVGSGFEWYPTDPSNDSRESIQCYVNDNNELPSVIRQPLRLTLDEHGIQEKETKTRLTDENSKKLDLIICINMIHISPWEATIGLMKTAQEMLAEGGVLFLYGPYKVNGTAVQSNLNFDLNLRSRDPSWGVRNLEDVIEAAKQHANLELQENCPIEMPANNLSLIFRRKEA